MIIEGADDTALAAYLDAHGQPKTREEVEEFASSLEKTSPSDTPEMREWYAGEVSKLGLDPAAPPLFKYLEADDRASH